MTTDGYSIQIEGVSRAFGDLLAVNNLSLSVKEGEVFGLLGPNGAGKTTLLKILTGQLSPTKGRALVLGMEPYNDPVAAKVDMGIVPEIESPPSFLTGREYLEYVGLIRGISDIQEKMEYWIKYLDMEDVQNVLGKDMSKGTKQRLMLSAAFIHDPKLLFLDEPFIGLDPYHQKHVKEYLERYVGEGGTIFICTHILEIAEKICTRIAIIDHGKIVSSGSVDELTNKGETLDDAFLRYTRGSRENL